MAPQAAHKRMERGEKKAGALSAVKHAASSREALPKFIPPQLATRVREVPLGERWIHEIKYDGYRILARKDGTKVTLFTRRAQDWTARFQAVADAVAALPAERCVVDGELTRVRPDGSTSFQDLQNQDRSRGALTFYLFDLLHLDGRNLRPLPLRARKEALQELLRKVKSGPLKYSDHFQGDAQEFYEHACEHRLEGIISKDADSSYVSGRTQSWCKVKCDERQEFVICGFTESKAARAEIGALLLGYYDGEKQLRYCGKVGTGYTSRMRRELLQTLREMEVERATVVNPKAAARDACWVPPKLVAQIAFREWTSDGMLRQPVFQGLRKDKKPREVTREQKIEAADISAPAMMTQKSSSKATAKKRAKKAGGKKNDVKKTNSKTSSAKKEARSRAASEETRFTNPQRVLFPESGITKEDLGAYYEKVGPWMLRDIAARPLVLVRCPEGRTKECFFQKHPGKMVPAELERVEFPERDGPAEYLVLRSPKELQELVQLSVLEIHAINCKAPKVEYPDRFIIDLDPDPALPAAETVDAARLLHELLEELGLQSFVRVSGGKGLHVVVPLAPRHTWEEVRSFSEGLARLLARGEPTRFTTVMSKAKRAAKIFIDFHRNTQGASAIANYSTRARHGAPVALPLRWDELGSNIRFDGFTMEKVVRRLARLRSDPWEECYGMKQRITAQMRKRLELK